MLRFVQATPETVEDLRLIAHESEAHWGYNKEFMDAFDRKFNITEEFILHHPVYVLWNDTAAVAFWGLRRDSDAWELEYFYVTEQDLGKGYGKQMWKHMTDWCKDRNIKSFHFVTSHQAVGFYEKMGAIQDGSSKSMIDGRAIPHFKYELDE